MLQHVVDLQTHVEPLADAIRGYVLAIAEPRAQQGAYGCSACRDRHGYVVNPGNHWVPCKHCRKDGARPGEGVTALPAGAATEEPDCFVVVDPVQRVTGASYPFVAGRYVHESRWELMRDTAAAEAQRGNEAIERAASFRVTAGQEWNRADAAVKETEALRAKVLEVETQRDDEAAEVIKLRGALLRTCLWGVWFEPGPHQVRQGIYTGGGRWVNAEGIPVAFSEEQARIVVALCDRIASNEQGRYEARTLPVATAPTGDPPLMHTHIVVPTIDPNTYRCRTCGADVPAPKPTTNESKPLTDAEESALREEYGNPNAHHRVTDRRDICGLLATLDATRTELRYTVDDREKYRGHLQAMLKRAERMPKVRAESTRNGVMLIIHELRRLGLVSDERLDELQAVASGAIEKDEMGRARVACAVCWLTLAECESMSPPCPGHSERQATKGAT